METKRTATKADEQALKSRLAFIIIILMVLSLTVCSYPKQDNSTQESGGSEEGTSFRLADSGFWF
jgi:uncharacterized membrane protein